MNTRETAPLLRHVGVAVSTWTLLVSLCSPAYAWNNRGHMMVAAVAYQKLTQAKKDRVNALLLLNPDRHISFPQASVCKSLS
jgi:hypothetical protein